MTCCESKVQEFTKKDERFNLEIQSGGLDNQIHCSFSMLPLQPNDSGKRNTAKSCTKCSKDIQNMQSNTLIITM